MSKINFINSLATVLALSASAAIAGTRDVHHFGKFFQNVRVEHVQPLLSGSAFVSHVDFEGPDKDSASGGEVSIAWFSDTHRYLCQGFPSNDVPYGVGKLEYKGDHDIAKNIRTKMALVAFSENGKETGVEYHFYDSSTGGLTNYWYQQYRLWEMNTGHLQTELPAVTWELCPDFPSAKSLGARVNKKQTAKYYLDLIKQDPGTRVMKPEYEAKEPPIVRLDLDFQPMPAQDR